MVYNFSAGPAAIPNEVRLKIIEQLPEFARTKASVMETSHRSVDFVQLAQKAQQDLKELMKIPGDYEVLFCHGGASLQFAMVPLNLLGEKTQACYALTGHWSQKAISEGSRYARVNICTNSSDNDFTDIEDVRLWQISDNNAFIHITPNETIAGLEFDDIPDCKPPIVADMSSNILSKKINIARYGIIYAGAQKNMGIAGLTVVIIKKSLMGLASNKVPALLNYEQYSRHNSMFNTPNTFSWYVASLVLTWLKNQGGVAAVAKINAQKAQLLYDFIDASGFYHNSVNVKYRSKMNVVFTLSDESLNQAFLDESYQAGLLALKGHKKVGGMRASIYNAMPLIGVWALVDFMDHFQKRYG